LPAHVTLPSYRASWPAVLPRRRVTGDGAYCWPTPSASGALVTHGQTTGLLDPIAHQSGQAEQTRKATLILVHDRWRRADALAIATDLQLMKSCLGRRLGRMVPVHSVLQWPRGLPTEDGGEGNASLSGKVLLLSEQPHWDVSDQGTGRLAAVPI
jgi:hypothetical protein